MNKILTISISGLRDTILFSLPLKTLFKTYHRAHFELLANRFAQETYSYAKEVSRVTLINFYRYISYLCQDLVMDDYETV